jgi:hypothetical protein
MLVRSQILFSLGYIGELFAGLLASCLRRGRAKGERRSARRGGDLRLAAGWRESRACGRGFGELFAAGASGGGGERRSGAARRRFAVGGGMGAGGGVVIGGGGGLHTTLNVVQIS